MKDPEQTDSNAPRAALGALYEQWQAGFGDAWAAFERCEAAAGGPGKHPLDCPKCRADREYLAALT